MKRTLLGLPITKIDRLKYIRQLRTLVSWKKAGCRGTIQAATAFGKTYCAIIGIRKIQMIDPNKTVVIIVPRIPLKEQWEEKVRKFGIKNCKVYVVNTVVLKKDSIPCDLLIIDEIHRMAADDFRRIFELIKFKWILGLTATLRRLDGKHSIVEKYAPVCDTITQKEAKTRGWISDFLEFNLAVNLTRSENEKILNCSKLLRKSLSRFRDYNHMISCMNAENAEAYALLMGWETKEVVKWAVNGNRAVHTRSAIFQKSERKIEVTVELIKQLGLKTITFSKSTEFADEVSRRVENAVTYHSNLKSELRDVVRTKVYKTQAGLDKFLKLKPAKFRLVDEGFEAYWMEKVLVGAKTLKYEAIKRIKDDRYKVSVINTAQALNEGFDVENMQLGIRSSGDRNPTTYVQQSGRIARNFTYKDGTKKIGVFINLYVPNTREEEQLREAQEGSDNVVWVDDIFEIIDAI